MTRGPALSGGIDFEILGKKRFVVLGTKINREAARIWRIDVIRNENSRLNQAKLTASESFIVRINRIFLG